MRLPIYFLQQNQDFKVDVLNFNTDKLIGYSIQATVVDHKTTAEKVEDKPIFALTIDLGVELFQPSIKRLINAPSFIIQWLPRAPPYDSVINEGVGPFIVYKD
jgi:hypothetical protein